MLAAAQEIDDGFYCNASFSGLPKAPVEIDCI
jgi:hypothetical protein